MQHNITGISQAARSIHRVNIELDGRFWLGISKDLLVAHKLYKGQHLTEDEISQLEEAADMEKIVNRAIGYLNRRPHSQQEVLTYLTQKAEVDPERAEQVISILKSRNLLSDLKFATWYVENRIQFGLHGRQKIAAELRQKGVTLSIINQVLPSELTSQQQKRGQAYLQKYLIKFARQQLSKRETEFKLSQQLIRRGFTFDQARQIVSELDID